MTSQIVSEESDIPYANGWRHLEGFDFKATQRHNHVVMKKHFCSSECLLDYIVRFVRMQEEELHKNNSYKA